MKQLSAWLASTGAVFLAASVVLAISQAPLGSPLFFACAGAAVAAYVAVLVRLRNETTLPPRLVAAALFLSLAFRAPLILPSVNFDSDMVRYVWDGRVQLRGYSPYQVVPVDPAVAAFHTDETRRMPSLRTPTPYPPAAQLFFRLVVWIHDSTRTMKLALALCDLLTILIIWRWLPLIGRPEWLVIAYAWNPLVVLEVAHSGHIDALGALWIAASAYWLTRRRTALASLAFVFAVATKLLPIVLLPLFWHRVRLRDAAVAALLLALLYLGYTQHGNLPFGALPNVVAHIRFNGPLFRFISGLSSPQFAAMFAVGSGMLVAAWCRWKVGSDHPASWAWPMATAVAAAPVIYSWYLLYFTPFLLSVATLPLTAWTISVIPTYIVWRLAYAHVTPWVVPSAVLRWEFALPLVTGAVVLARSRILTIVRRAVARNVEPAEHGRLP
jgi:alpha-1,6-mannosyltransferase